MCIVASLARRDASLVRSYGSVLGGASMIAESETHPTIRYMSPRDCSPSSRPRSGGAPLRTARWPATRAGQGFQLCPHNSIELQEPRRLCYSPVYPTDAIVTGSGTYRTTPTPGPFRMIIWSGIASSKTTRHPVHRLTGSHNARPRLKRSLVLLMHS